MLGLVCDTVVLALLVTWLQGGEPEWLKLGLVAFGMAVVNLVIVLLLGGFLGIFVLVPIVIVDGFILMLFCSLTIKQAAVAVAILLAYQLVFQLAITKLFAVPQAEAMVAAVRSVWC
ncbi:MAG: hypothetical protein WD875_13025 [Pirellulales bacterium]